jgi:hypothetical protein
MQVRFAHKQKFCLNSKKVQAPIFANFCSGLAQASQCPSVLFSFFSPESCFPHAFSFAVFWASQSSKQLSAPDNWISGIAAHS